MYIYIYRYRYRMMQIRTGGVNSLNSWTTRLNSQVPGDSHCFRNQSKNQPMTSGHATATGF